MGLDRGIFMVSKKGILPIKSFRYRNGYNNYQKWGLKLCQNVVRIRRLWKPSVVLFCTLIEGSLEVKLPTIWTDEKQSREDAERRERVEEKESEERRYRCAKR